MSTGKLQHEHTGGRQEHLELERRQHNLTGISSISRRESKYDPSYAYPSRSQASSSVNSEVRRKDARDLFEEYGVSRPHGWLSEASSGGNHPSQPVSEPHDAKLCHSCHLRVPDRKECSSCGHDGCLKCTKTSPFKPPPLEHIVESSSTQHERYETVHHENIHHCPIESVAAAEQTPRHRSNDGASTPRASVLSEAQHDSTTRKSSNQRKEDLAEPRKRDRNVSSTFAKNPFIQADRSTKALPPKTSSMNVEAKQSPHLSDCLPRRHMGYSREGVSHLSVPPSPERRESYVESTGGSSNLSAFEQLASRDHHSTKHSSTRGHRSHHHDPLDDPLERKIDQLYHHGEDLYHSQHILEHLAAGSKHLHGKATESQRGHASSSHKEESSSTEEADPRLHSLGADEFGEPARLDLHELDVDREVPVGRQITRPRLHSLSADRLGEEQRLARHSLLQDPMMDVELSPKSPAVGELMLSKAHDWHRSYSLRPETPAFELPATEVPKERQESLRSMDQKPASPVFKPSSPKAWLNRVNSRSNAHDATVRWVHDDAIQVRPRYSTRELARHSQDECKLYEELRHHEDHALPDPVPDQWPRLRRVDKTIPEKTLHSDHATKAPWTDQSLRKVDQGHSKHVHDTKMPKSPHWRQNLRKVEESKSHVNHIQTTKQPLPPAQEIRSLNHDPSEQAQSRSSLPKDAACGHCHPSQTSQTGSSTHEQSAGVCLVVENEKHGYPEHFITSRSNQSHDHGAQVIDHPLSTPFQLRLRDLEHSLARQSAEDLLQSQRESLARRKSSILSQEILRKEANVSTVHNPRPVLPPDHTCE